MSFHVFSPKDVAVVVGAIPIDAGDFASEFINITFNEDAFNLRMGAGGGGTRTFTNNLSARIELTLLYGSAANARLSAQFAADRDSGAGIGPFALVDMKSGTPPTTVFKAQNCWIVKMPDMALGSESPDVTWILETDRLLPTLGTNFVV